MAGSCSLSPCLSPGCPLQLSPCPRVPWQGHTAAARGVWPRVLLLTLHVLCCKHLANTKQPRALLEKAPGVGLLGKTYCWMCHDMENSSQSLPAWKEACGMCVSLLPIHLLWD